MKQTLITAHSGCECTPDNSIASVRAGMQAGADCVEVDVRLGAQGELLLTHDLPGEGECPVTLEQAFSCLQGSGTAINCDLKEYAALLPTLALAEKMGIGPQQLCFSGSVDIALLLEDASIARRSRIYINSEELYFYLSGEHGDRARETEYLDAHLREAVELVQRIGAEALNAPYTWAPQERIAALHNAGLQLSLWTVNDTEHLRALLGLGLRNITTRIPSAAVHLRSGLSGERPDKGDGR